MNNLFLLLFKVINNSAPYQAQVVHLLNFFLILYSLKKIIDGSEFNFFFFKYNKHNMNIRSFSFFLYALKSVTKLERIYIRFWANVFIISNIHFFYNNDCC